MSEKRFFRKFSARLPGLALDSRCAFQEEIAATRTKTGPSLRSRLLLPGLQKRPVETLNSMSTTNQNPEPDGTDRNLADRVRINQQMETFLRDNAMSWWHQSGHRESGTRLAVRCG